ncbi:hypothetical protein H113_05240 [Trichophyton rubrum MR1459]|uniref:Secreted protein n=1 Tax=Trichophyton rubrum (strain ATCC MYA-4607 / CBS 118892) TaxID=559305 RepID=A0A080WJV5_TRIRC|nr:uncharacterized protein TERG_11920 [Trichophyton rubrum CBS 118892]EZF94331.1 hypothetical protein H113_05240 [Trichophyton rubrum MR1459]EZG05307.1 hypothetical protein H106_05040 [Trichophyton rubrum CBS 735.88]KFL61017.1 hypothetical protein TERG_11920 [Trichophyton rubrum CBS 118892]
MSTELVSTVAGAGLLRFFWLASPAVWCSASVCRRSPSIFQSDNAAVSADFIRSSVSSVGKVSPLSTVRPFCSLIREFSNASNVSLCCFTAAPLTASALAACDIDAVTISSPLAISRRSSSRSLSGVLVNCDFDFSRSSSSVSSSPDTSDSSSSHDSMPSASDSAVMS